MVIPCTLHGTMGMICSEELMESGLSSMVEMYLPWDVLLLEKCVLLCVRDGNSGMEEENTRMVTSPPFAISIANKLYLASTTKYYIDPTCTRKKWQRMFTSQSPSLAGSGGLVRETVTWISQHEQRHDTFGRVYVISSEDSVLQFGLTHISSSSKQRFRELRSCNPACWCWGGRGLRPGRHVLMEW